MAVSTCRRTVEGWKRVTQCTDGRIPLQEQSTVLQCAAVIGNPGAVQILVDSKADMEAVDEVAMRPAQPGVTHASDGGGAAA